MKRRGRVRTSLVSFCMAIVIALQSVTFSAAAYAENASDGFGTAAEPSSVSEAVYAAPDEPSSVPEAVYAPPVNFALMAADPKDKTAVLVNANPTFNLTVKQGDPAVVIQPGARLTDGTTLPLP